MGCWREIALAATLALGSGEAVAGEPLVTAKLADPETHLLAMDGSSNRPVIEDRNTAFLNALIAAGAARQQATDAQCRSVSTVPSGGEARLNWEANCRYRRR